MNINNKIKKLHEEKHVHSRLMNEQTKNSTDVAFSDDEMLLLNKGLKYNLHHKPKRWLQTLGIKADTAVNMLPRKDQSYIWQTVANNNHQIIKNKNPKREMPKNPL